ncbi:MAG: glycoside hydrolase family 31 protein, partial [Tumebacillaceae bacterium]
MQGSEAILPDQYQGKQGTYSASIRNVVSLVKEQGAYLLHCENALVALQFLTDRIFRVKLSRSNGISLAFGPQIETHVGNTEPAVALDETDDAYRFRTSALDVYVEKAPFRIRVQDGNGTVLAEDVELGWTDKLQPYCVKRKASDENFYGFGEKTGFLNKAGTKQTMWNSDVYAPHVPEIDALYQSIPFFLSSRGSNIYGLFLDNPGKTEFHMNEADTYRFQAENGELDTYFLYGPTMKDVVQQYTDLTGRMPLPPKWAIGYHQSRYSYETEQEVRELAANFRDKDIPCDVIYLDIHYMNEYRVFTWHPTSFPQPGELLADLREQGFRVVPIVDPGVKKDPKYVIYQEGVRYEHFCKYIEGELYTGVVWPGESAFPDFTDSRTRAWWGEKHAGYVEAGIEGIWNDMNEPAIFNETKTMDVNVMHKNDGDPKTHGELHNVYGLYMSQATYEGMKTQLQGKRPFVLTRAGYAGIQKYAAVWTGDNRSFWEHLQMSIPMILNMGLSGIPFAGADVGGFAHDSNGELLARWTQVGAFLPYFRNHSAIGFARQEPWSFGTPYESVVRQYIQMRYHFLPHLYTLFHDASTTGLPIVRPLVMEYPNDATTQNLCDQFLLGTSLLIAPILRPDTEHRVVYLPEGNWVNYWTGETFTGPQHIMVHAPLDMLPIFVQEGTIYAAGSIVSHTGEAQEITYHLYRGNGSYTHYEDNGETFEYEEGSYNLLKVMQETVGNHVSIGWGYEHHGYYAVSANINLHLHFVDE